MIKKLLFFLFTIFMSVNMMASTVSDTIVASDLAATTTTYTNFSNVHKNSGAIYAGNSAKSSDEAIQMRSKNSNSGIVSTTSGGKVKSIKIIVASGSNTIDIYGSNTAYTSASNLYATGGTNQGTKIGSLSATGTINVTDSFNYIGIRSNSGAIYISSIIITWDTTTSVVPVDPPVNLGEKTIAEFLELKNPKDTCILTGVVDSIYNTTYGNLYLRDETDTLLVYGVLTPAGESKKFDSLNVEVNDTLTIKATYTLFNNIPEAKNAVFVSVKKYVEPVDPGITTDINIIENKETAYKIFDGRQIVIYKDNKKYNLIGLEVQ